MPPKKASKSPSLIKQGLLLGVGLNLGSMIFVLLALAFLIPGGVLLYRERKKPKDQQRKEIIIVSVVLLGIGCVLGLGLGFPILMQAISEL